MILANFGPTIGSIHAHASLLDDPEPQPYQLGMNDSVNTTAEPPYAAQQWPQLASDALSATSDRLTPPEASLRTSTEYAAVVATRQAGGVLPDEQVNGSGEGFRACSGS